MPITIKRKSDGKSFALPATINPTTRVGALKTELHTNFKPKFEHGCRIVYQGKVLKSIHKLTHYGKTKNGLKLFLIFNLNFKNTKIIQGVQENTELEMDDSKNWSSSSSSSDSDRN